MRAFIILNSFTVTLDPDNVIVCMMFQSDVVTLMVLCIGGCGAGKTLLLSLLQDKNFNTDTSLVPTVGVNIFTILAQTGKKNTTVEIPIRELGGGPCPLWRDYLKSETSVIFVINSLDLSKAGLVAVKLCETLAELESVSREENKVCRLCVVWTRSGDVNTFARVLRLRELVQDSCVIYTEIRVDIETQVGLQSIRHWLLQSVA